MGVMERREREKKERREAIVLAASSVFLSKGLGSATMEDIAREAELSKGALYLYFKNKDELFLQIALSALADFEKLISEVSQEPLGSAEKVKLLLQKYVRYASKHRSRFQVAMSWLNPSYSVDGDSEKFVEYKAAVERVYIASIALLKEGERSGQLVLLLSPERTWFQCWGALLGLLMLENSHHELERRLPMESGGVEGLAHEFIDTFMGILTPASS